MLHLKTVKPKRPIGQWSKSVQRFRGKLVHHLIKDPKANKSRPCKAGRPKTKEAILRYSLKRSLERVSSPRSSSCDWPPSSDSLSVIGYRLSYQRRYKVWLSRPTRINPFIFTPALCAFRILPPKKPSMLRLCLLWVIESGAALRPSCLIKSSSVVLITS